MLLNINDSRYIENPDSATVIAALRQLGYGEYAILERDEDNYIQTRFDEDCTWQLEYRDGSEERHFATDPENTTLKDVCKAFTAYIADIDVAPLLEWEHIEAAPTEPGEGEVWYNGVVMDAEWPAAIEAAQEVATIRIGDVLYERIPFGKEDNMPTSKMRVCSHCGVLNGQLHVPDCDIEQCPKCFGELLSCGCTD